MSFGQFDGFGHHTHASRRRWGKYNFCSQEAHQLASLDAEGLRHRDNKRIPFLCAYHGQPNSRIPACSFNHRLTWLELSRLLCIIDHPQSQTIFHRTEWIECFDFDKEIDMRRRQPVDPDNWGVADCFQDVGISLSHSFLLRIQAIVLVELLVQFQYDLLITE